jgi:hypothetical protein
LILNSFDRFGNFKTQHSGLGFTRQCPRPLLWCRPRATRECHAGPLSATRRLSVGPGPSPTSSPRGAAPDRPPLLHTATPFQSTDCHRADFFLLRPFLSHSTTPRAPFLPIASCPSPTAGGTSAPPDLELSPPSSVRGPPPLDGFSAASPCALHSPWPLLATGL